MGVAVTHRFPEPPRLPAPPGLRAARAAGGLACPSSCRQGPQRSPESRAARRAVARTMPRRKTCCLEVNNVVAISGLRSGAAGGGAARSGRTGPGVPAAAGFDEETEAGPLGDLGEQVRGFYAKPACEF